MTITVSGSLAFGKRRWTEQQLPLHRSASESVICFSGLKTREAELGNGPSLRTQGCSGADGGLEPTEPASQSVYQASFLGLNSWQGASAEPARGAKEAREGRPTGHRLGQETAPWPDIPSPLPVLLSGPPSRGGDHTGV